MLKAPGYESTGEIAMGDLARVVRARHIETGAAVVLKWLHADLFPDPAVREVFLQEVRRLATLNHPGFVRTREAGVDERGRMYVVQDFAPGVSSAVEVAKQGPIAELRALRWAREVGQTLEHAWTRERIMHGHLHPDNVMLDPSGDVRVADLGLSRLVARLSGAAGSGRAVLRGTLHYLAPEQIETAAALDTRTDIYALGLVLYHWLTGRVPFEEAWNEDLAERLKTGRLPALRDARPGLSRGLESLLSAMTAHDRAERYPDWDTLLRDMASVEGGRRPLRPAAADSAVPAPPPPKPERAKPTWPASRAGAENGTTPEVPGGNGTRKIILSKKEQRHLRGIRQQTGGSGAARVLAVGILLTAGTLFALHRYGVRMDDIVPLVAREGGPSDAATVVDLPQGTTPYREVPARTPRRTEPSLRLPARVPESETEAEQAVGTRDPRFLRGARHFNTALSLYRRYQEDRSDAAALRRIEEFTQSALQEFTAFQEDNPEHRQVAQYIDQCYGMIRYARQSLLMDHGLAGRTRDGAREPRRPAPMRPQPGGHAALRLAAGWSVPPRAEERLVAGEMADLLGPRGTARVDLAARPDLHVFPGIPYLVPASEAAARYRVDLPPGLLIRHPGFPAASVRAYSLEGSFPGGWSRLRLYTDLAGQVIAAQVIDETPGTPRLPPVLFSPNWQVHDLGSGRTKPEPNQLVAHRIRSAGAVVQIESELARADASAEAGVGTVISRSTLYLPQPILDLMLARLASR